MMMMENECKKRKNQDMKDNLDDTKELLSNRRLTNELIYGKDVYKIININKH